MKTPRTLSHIAGLVLVTTLVGCDNSERNVITERGPFFQTEISYDRTRTDSVVEALRTFSQRHEMDFLLARESLGPGEFNASANGPSLNLQVMHIEPFDKGLSITAISRADPTPQDQALVAEFVAQIRASGGPR